MFINFFFSPQMLVVAWFHPENFVAEIVWNLLDISLLEQIYNETTTKNGHKKVRCHLLLLPAYLHHHALVRNVISKKTLHHHLSMAASRSKTSLSNFTRKTAFSLRGGRVLFGFEDRSPSSSATLWAVTRAENPAPVKTPATMPDM